MDNIVTLLHSKSYLAGKWLDADDSSVIEVINPATGDIIGTVPNMGRAEAKEAIENAYQAFQTWRNLTAKQRSGILRKWYELILTNIDVLAQILTTEQGKPLQQAKAEIENGISYIEWYAEEAKRIYGDVIAGNGIDSKIMVLKQPVGVAALITPWNFPAAMIMRKAAPALAAGCSVIVKPSELTPFSALALADLAEKAGMPAGVFNVITGSPEAIGKEFCQNKLVRKLSFTGSTAVGKLLMKQSADNLTKLSLELGGNAPFIVFKDADIKKAAKGAVISKFRNSGQTCICANRIFVEENIYDEFLEEFIKEVKELNIGSGFEDSVDIGPMINKAAVKKANEILQDALDKGAKLVLGGASEDLFYSPTILTDVTDDMRCFGEEIFAPIAPIFKFQTEKEIIVRANNTDYGLASYIYTNDMAKFWRISESLEYGMVGVNTCLLATEQAPFGGIKSSGLGREGSKYGIDDYLELKYLNIDIS